MEKVDVLGSGQGGKGHQIVKKNKRSLAGESIMQLVRLKAKDRDGCLLDTYIVSLSQHQGEPDLVPAPCYM